MQNATEKKPKNTPEKIVDAHAELGVATQKGLETAGPDTTRATGAAGNEITKAAEGPGRAIQEADTPAPAPLKTRADPVAEPVAPMA